MSYRMLIYGKEKRPVEDVRGKTLNRVLGAGETADEVWEWKKQAACRGKDTDLFFRTANKEAKKICETCPVTSECLANAMRIERRLPADFRYGLWGGHTPEQRWALDGSPTRLANGAAVRDKPEIIRVAN
jgi:WhiB family redox-sensing transcriptional regulator